MESQIFNSSFTYRRRRNRGRCRILHGEFHTPNVFYHLFENADWARRILGVCCNDSNKEHAELDESDTFDDANPVGFGKHHRTMRDKAPWLNVFGGCCGCDMRHVKEIAHAFPRNP